MYTNKQLTANDTSEGILVVSNKSLFLESTISVILEYLINFKSLCVTF